jgi:hypothetical protein
MLGLTSVIVATQKAERIMVPSQPGQNNSQDPIPKNPSQIRAGGVAQGVGPDFKLQKDVS